MVDALILLAVIVLMIFAVKGSIKHFKGESPCCQRGEPEQNAKKLDGVIIKEKDFKIAGMRCANCAYRVEKAINRIDGVSSRVDFPSGTAHVSYSSLVDDDSIIEAVRSSGYDVKKA